MRLSQILPLRYSTEYTDVSTGNRHACDWRMWLGRCFAIDDRVIA